MAFCPFIEHVTQMLLHRESFTHRCVYTQKLLQTEVFTHVRLYTEQFLQIDAFKLYTRKFLHKNFYTLDS